MHSELERQLLEPSIMCNRQSSFTSAHQSFHTPAFENNVNFLDHFVADVLLLFHYLKNLPYESFISWAFILHFVESLSTQKDTKCSTMLI